MQRDSMKITLLREWLSRPVGAKLKVMAGVGKDLIDRGTAYKGHKRIQAEKEG